MVLYGYYPGTRVAAIATGSLHALVGFFGMLVGWIAHALSYENFKKSLLAQGANGKVRLRESLPTPKWAIWMVFLQVSLFSFQLIRRSGETVKTA